MFLVSLLISKTFLAVFRTYYQVCLLCHRNISFSFKNIECDPFHVANGAVNDTSVVYGTVVQVTCDSCFLLQGDGLARCDQDGQWNFTSSCILKGLIMHNYK